MTAPRLVLGGALAALLLASTSASAMQVSGEVDTGYLRTDNWASGSPTTTIPMWDYGGSLSLSGSPLRPGLLSLDGGLDYRKVQTYYSVAPSDAADWGYHGVARLFSDSPFNLNLSASQAWNDFTSQTNAPGVASVQSTGSNFTRTEGADLAWRPDQRLPGLRASIGRTTSEFTGFAQPLTDATNTYLSLGAGQTIGVHSYDIGYTTNWNSGSYADTNYQSHLLNIYDDSHLSKNLEFRFAESYFLRDPTLESPFNPRIDDNSLTSGLFWQISDPLRGETDYAYHRIVAEAPDTPTRESLQHGLNTAGEYRYTSRLTFLGNFGANYDSERLGDGSYNGTGEQVGGGLRYTDKLTEHESWFATGNGSVGLLQQAGATGQFAYGAGAGGGLSTRRDRWTGTASYTFSYSSNLAARAGSSFSQGLSASIETLFLGARVQGMGNAQSTRYDDPLLGANLNRTANFTLTAQWRRETLQLTYGLSDGLARTLLGGSSSDGLFLPAGYDTHSRYASGQAGFQLARQLNLSFLGLWVQSSAPGRPDEYERTGAVDLSYALGAFTLSAEERYSTGGAGGLTQNGNSFFFRVSRGFGARF